MDIIASLNYSIKLNFQLIITIFFHFYRSSNLTNCYLWNSWGRSWLVDIISWSSKKTCPPEIRLVPERKTLLLFFRRLVNRAVFCSHWQGLAQILASFFTDITKSSKFSRKSLFSRWMQILTFLIVTKFGSSEFGRINFRKFFCFKVSQKAEPENFEKKFLK